MTRSWKKSARWAPALGAALLALGVTLALKGRPKEPATSGVTEIHRQDLVQRVTVAGTIIPKKRTVIVPPYTGYIKKIYVKVGDLVRMGDPIVSVVQSLASAAEVYPIRAPFPGSVVQVLRSDGEYVEEKSDNNVIVRIDDLSSLLVIADSPEMEMVKVKVGQEVVVKASALPARSYHGTVQEISLAARERKEWWRSNEKVEFPIRIEVTDKDQWLKPGMSCLIDIIADKRVNVLTLRHEYIQKKDDRYYVILEDGTRREIEVGLSNEEMFEVTKGLKEGDRVRPTDFIRMATET
jgi:multidrug efflux pump subunit AcrA (membrane-fusion protein)